MRYLKLTIQRNRRRIQIEQLLLLLLRICPAGVVVLLPGAAGAQPDGAGAMAGQRRPVQPGRADRRLAEHGLRGRRMRRHSSGRRETAAALLASVRPQDRCTLVTTSAPRTPVLHEVEGSRRDELTAAVAVRAADRHARRMAGGARGRRRGVAILHLSDAAAHDLHRLAEERAGKAAIAAIARRWSEAGRPGADRGRGRRRDRQRLAPVARCRWTARSWPARRAAGRR